MDGLPTKNEDPPVILGRSPRAARILGIGVYRPDRIVGNEEICRRIDSSDEWIRARSGISSRRVAATESIPDMAAWAAGKALSMAGLTPADVSCVVLATMSYLHQAPPASAACAAELGAGTAACFDVGAACAGFSHALAIANSLVAAGEARYVVVAGSERMSDIVDPGDRGTAFLFGDGAGAVVVGPAAEPGIGPVVWGSDTAYLHAIETGSFAALRTSDSGHWPYLEMAGTAVFRWAIGALADVAQRALAAAGLTVGAISAFVPHQANLRIIDAVADRLGLPSSVEVARQVVREDGNTSAASIPMALESLISTGRVRPGDLALLVGFGSGLSYSAQVVAVP